MGPAARDRPSASSGLGELLVALGTGARAIAGAARHGGEGDQEARRCRAPEQRAAAQPRRVARGHGFPSSQNVRRWLPSARRTPGAAPGVRGAERGGFEPPEGCPSTVFKTDAIVRSAISPSTNLTRGGAGPARFGRPREARPLDQSLIWPRRSAIQSSARRQAASASRRTDGAVLAGGGVRAEELHVGHLRLEVAEAVGHELVGEVALEVDHEAVVAEALLGGPRLELGEVDGPGRELLEDRRAGCPAGRPAGRRRWWSCRGRSARGCPSGRRPRSGWCSRGGPRCRWPATSRP